MSGAAMSLMPISHRRHGQDKTVLSCLVPVCGGKWTHNKSRLSATENFETEHVQLFAALSSLEMRCELSGAAMSLMPMTSYQCYLVSLVILAYK